MFFLHKDISFTWSYIFAFVSFCSSGMVRPPYWGYYLGVKTRLHQTGCREVMLHLNTLRSCGTRSFGFWFR